MQVQAAALIRPGSVLGSRVWPALGFLTLLLPTLLSVARQHWSREDGAHGPIIFATALWLVWRARGTIRDKAAPPRKGYWALALVPLLAAYAFARAYNILSVETGTLYLLFLLLAFGYCGAAVLRALWFPFLYIAFLIVPPGSLVTEATLPLKLWLSGTAVDLLYWLGYPVAETGAVISIAQYELMVETACAGLGSLLTLSALGLLYVHLRWSSGLGRSLALMALVVPIAVLANFIRVILLVLMTYYFGNDFAQGVAHDLAGMLMFVISMLCMLAADSLLQRVLPRAGQVR